VSKTKIYKIHTLGKEKQRTGYGTTISATGCTKYYDENAPEGRRWKTLPPLVEEKFIEAIKKIEEYAHSKYFESNPYGVVGLVDKNTKKFSILKQKKGEGKVCTSFTKKELIDIIARISKVHASLEPKNLKYFFKKRMLVGDDVVVSVYGYSMIGEDIYDTDLREVENDSKKVKRYVTEVWKSLKAWESSSGEEKDLEELDAGELCDILYNFFLKGKMLWFD
jgi:hypothetical protein